MYKGAPRETAVEIIPPAEEIIVKLGSSARLNASSNESICRVVTHLLGGQSKLNHDRAGIVRLNLKACV